jgi:nucleoside triphosphate diphosphatase
MSELRPFDALLELCARLRSPQGCPWDRQQTFESLKPYIIEEAYEVVEGIGEASPELLAGELGDLLFQIVFVAQLAREQGLFDMDDVCRKVHTKMVRRHPHVFAETEVTGAAEVVRNWEAIKQRERVNGSALDGVPRHLPALLKAARISEKAAARSFSRPAEDAALRQALELVIQGDRAEEAQELAASGRLAHVIGEVLFAIADRSRVLGVDAESALQDANRRFAESFASAERAQREAATTAPDPHAEGGPAG